jgi:hypothetical protein
MEHPTPKRRWIVKTKKKLSLKRTTLRVLSGTDLGGVAGGTTIIVVFSAPTVVTTATVSALGCSIDCNRGTTGLAGR